MTSDEPRFAMKGNQPFLAAPWAVLALVGLLLALHAVYYVGNDYVRNYILFWGAFLPLRLTGEAALLYPDVPARGVWGLLTHAFVHGSWEHVAVNSLWLLVFGTLVARRIGSWRFVLLFLLGAAAGACAQALLGVRDEFLLGASGGVAALFGASLRFAFRGPWQDWARPEERTPLMSLRAMLSNRAVLTLLAVWAAAEILFVVQGLSFAGLPVQIAWGAHLGGFVSGLFLIWILDQPVYSPSGGPGQVRYGAWAGSTAEKNADKDKDN